MYIVELVSDGFMINDSQTICMNEWNMRERKKFLCNVILSTFNCLYKKKVELNNVNEEIIKYKLHVNNIYLYEKNIIRPMTRTKRLTECVIMFKFVKRCFILKLVKYLKNTVKIFFLIKIFKNFSTGTID